MILIICGSFCSHTATNRRKKAKLERALNDTTELICSNDSIVESERGSAPRTRQGEAPATAGADPSGLPGLPRFF